MAADDVLFETRGTLGLITLNRPRQLNALTLEMVRLLRPRLDAWAEDPAIAVVAIRGAGDKAFCAGGDIRWLYDVGRADPERAAEFYHDEYRLNARIKRYPKPYVAFMDGVVMGGGVGLSVHGRFRVGGDRSMFAMPETGIGLFPDVGGSYFLPRLPRRIGWFLALTGTRLRVADCRFAGLVDFYVPSDRTEQVLAALAAADYSGDANAAARAVLSAASAEPGPAPLSPHAARIETLFDAGSLTTAIGSLVAADGWAAEQAALIESKSPLFSRIAWRMLAEGARLDFEDCLRMEYRLACASLRSHDFFEGVRAAVVDKDRAPRWSPPRLAAVDDALVAAAFEPPAGGDLSFD